jgi:uncharacterized protein YbjQ (UPF0145 family)
MTALVLFSAAAVARTTIHHFKIADFFNNPSNAGQLEDVAFYFGEQSHPAVTTKFGEYRTNKKTNAFNKSDKEACEWVMLSALIQFRDKARSLGANAVVNIRSNFKNNLFVSETEYSCGAGGLMAGVALIGDFVKLEE